MRRALTPELTESERAHMRGIVVEILGEEKAALWWKSDNPMFGGISPDFMVWMGRERKVYNFVMDAREMNQAAPGKTP